MDTETDGRLQNTLGLGYHISDVIKDERSEGTLILSSELDELLPFSKSMESIKKTE